jgi:hypothetical protein
VYSATSFWIAVTISAMEAPDSARRTAATGAGTTGAGSLAEVAAVASMGSASFSTAHPLMKNS